MREKLVKVRKESQERWAGIKWRQRKKETWKENEGKGERWREERIKLKVNKRKENIKRQTRKVINTDEEKNRETLMEKKDKRKKAEK